MKPAQIKPVSYLANHAAEFVREDMQQQTLALLKILALGRKEMEAGEVIAAKDVFAELKQMAA
ncbi:hypothetical protein [Paraburkholderia sp.]|uniref:hypothetical protein n=1 Tax=Paraburkholderia sp. TaxID=1926495 RepID=UPI00286FA51B|nr:hypothetical protein [Paraburkholderia sp.]